MLAITLGFAENGRSAPPVPLYVGNDASAAEAIFLTPPDGIIRTEMFKNPTVTRRRSIEAVAAASPPLSSTPEDTPPPAKPSKAKA